MLLMSKKQWKVDEFRQKTWKNDKKHGFGRNTVFQKGLFFQLCPVLIKVTEVGGTVLGFGKNPLFPKTRKKRCFGPLFRPTFVGRRSQTSETIDFVTYLCHNLIIIWWYLCHLYVTNSCCYLCYLFMLRLYHYLWW